MTVEQITAQKLNETIENYPDLLELEDSGQWHEITHIANYRIINGAWTSTGEQIFITCGDKEYTFNLMDKITVRYTE